MPIALSDLLDERQIALRLKAHDQHGALHEIVQLLAANRKFAIRTNSSGGKIENAQEFLEQLLEREKLRPSTVEHSVAFPHLRTDLVDEIVLGIGRSRPGVPFGKGELAKLIFVIGLPQRLANEYLVTVGALARLLKDEEIRKSLVSAKSAAEFIDALK
jgi:mannitol/fructose-specific phosphotransferase system IIA component (Ntr-type)